MAAPLTAATSSLDPFVFDDELIPFYGACCVVNSCFLRTPDCYGGHGADVQLCCNSEFTCCKPGRNPDEYVIVNDGLFSIVKVNFCCKGARQVFCLDSRYVFFEFKDNKILDDKFPCLCNIFGLTLVYNFMLTPMCCKKWGEIKNATGTPLMKKQDAAPAPAAAPTDVVFFADQQ